METLKKTIAAMAICLAALSASAAVLTQEGFETSRASFVADNSGEDYSAVTNYLNEADKPAAVSAYPFNVSGYGSKYLAVDTGDTILRHSFATNSSSVYFDAMVKFTTTEGGDAEYEEGSKFTLYLDAATSNLCAISGTSADNRAVVTNRLDSMTIVPGSWGRLTVNALRSDGVFAFQVRVNGTLLTASGVDTFYSMTADTTMSEVNFTGCGALDNVAVRTTDPYLPAVGAVASVDGRYYASLADAFEESTSDDTVILLANNAEDINLTEGQTFKLKANGFSYSGTVYSYSGYRLKISDPDENGVITYSQAAPYKPSISINFTNAAGNGLTTSDDVGLSDYEVPGTSWNNFTIPNNAVEQTLGTVNAVDSTGAASVESGVSVTVSNQRGSYLCSLLTAASNPLQSYIDEAADKTTPTVTVSGIPYYRYRVIVYHSTDTGNVPFGYDTINGTNYTYVNDALVEGTTAWGASGAQNTANAMSIGGNVLVTGELSGPTLTVVGHRAGGADNARGCIAAIQIIEIKPEITENDLEIPVSGATTYTVDTTKSLSGTVYLTGNGTLTLDGSAKISAATIDVGLNVTLNVNADRLDGTTFVGAGTVVYDGTKPGTGKGWTDTENWSGTVWVKNISTSSIDRKDWNLALYGNANSTLRFTGVNLYFPNNTTTTFAGAVDIDGAGMNVCDGYGGSIATIARLTGSGTLSTAGGSSNGNGLTINDASAFTGTITLTKYKVIIGTATGTSASGVLQIESGKSITVAGATAPGGFVVNGKLVANGTLASSASAAVTGSGTVVFGGVPSPVDGENETKWWKNAAWTGTVEIKGVNNITGTSYAFSDYGNAESTVKLTNCSGWLKTNYTCVPALEIGGTFSWTDGYSGLNNTFKVGTLKGSGTISIPNQGAATAVWQITDDWSGFTGAVIGNNDAAKRVLVFGPTLPASVTAGEIYVSEGATLDLNNSSAAWWGVGMGFVVDGTVRAINRAKWGGGTYMTLGDTGVLEITRSDSASADDGGTDYSNVTGTGTIRFAGDGFTVISQSIPTSLTFAAEKASGSVVPVAGATIGSLTGSKGFRSDWGTTGDGGRYLTIKQSKDTIWDGLICVGGSHRLTGVIVDPGESATGTLTMTATHTNSSTLTVNGAVNLTGTWVGTVDVAGTFGGTGTVTGNLTLSDGATIKVNDMSDLLTVTGNLTTTAGTTVKIELPAGARKGMKCIDVTGTVDINSGTKFEVYVGGERKRYLSAKALKDGSGVKVTCPPFQVRFLSPSSSAAN